MSACVKSIVMGLGGLCASAAGQRRMLGGARRADRVIPLNLSEWVTLFRVGVATS